MLNSLSYLSYSNTFGIGLLKVVNLLQDVEAFLEGESVS